VGASIYQIYPRSFADSDSDGIGDLSGIIDHLDYVAELGVDTVWVSPFFASPQLDLGYDITDYTAVSPEYGTLADAERLIGAAHDRGLRILFDLVLNHTSDQHPWFLRSRASRNNPQSDWYIWADGRGRAGRRPPNNWRSAMEVNSAWQYSPQRRQWYLATFLPFQPDLNWRNPQVRAAMLAAIRFWLDRGVDGFRLDIFGMIMKDPQLRDNPLAPRMDNGFPRLHRRRYTENTPDTIELARDLHRLCAEYGDRILLGEVFGSPEVLREYHAGGNGLDLVFLFDFLTFRYDARWFADTITAFEGSFPAPMQPTYVLENHDRSRSIDRVGGDPAKAAVLAVIQLTARGVAAIYMGQEIGMANTYIPLRDAVDPVAAAMFSWIPEAVNRRLPERLNRDEVRTPMQWSAAENAGFTPPGITPWLPVNAAYPRVNVAAQADHPGSLLRLYRRLLLLRRDLRALREGRLDLLPGMPPGVLGYRRNFPGHPEVRILANLGHEQPRVRVPVAAPDAYAAVPDILLACGGASVERGHAVLPADSALLLCGRAGG
jgi:glycosidase